MCPASSGLAGRAVPAAATVAYAAMITPGPDMMDDSLDFEDDSDLDEDVDWYEDEDAEYEDDIETVEVYETVWATVTAT